MLLALKEKAINEGHKFMNEDLKDVSKAPKMFMFHAITKE